MKKRIVIYQQELLGEIPQPDIETIKKFNPDFVALPEYFFHPLVTTYEKSIELMIRYSVDFNCILIGGTTVLNENGNLYNCCYIFNKGEEIGHYRKINLFHREFGRITPGDKHVVLETGGTRIGLMICADALSDEAWQGTAELNPDIVFIPTFSPFKHESIQDKFLRDEKIYVEGAKVCRSPVVKICCIGKFHDTLLQGRSLVAEETGILWRVLPEDEDKKIIKVTDIEF